MPAPRILPPYGELRALKESGMTHRQIADHVYATTGVRVARSAVSAALSRAGLTSREAVRYKDELPWKVGAGHLMEYPPRMLRLLGRRHAGLKLNADDALRLDSWLETLEKEGLVVAYCPDTTPGFIYVEADEIDDCPNGIPIRIRTISKEEVIE